MIAARQPSAARSAPASSCAADALTLQPGLDAEQRQAPDALADERERRPDDLAVELGDPRARRVAVAEVADPQSPALCVRGTRRRVVDGRSSTG